MLFQFLKSDDPQQFLFNVEFQISLWLELIFSLLIWFHHMFYIGIISELWMLIQKLGMCINFHLLLKQLLTNHYYRGIIRYLELFLSEGLCCYQGIIWGRQGSNSFTLLDLAQGRASPSAPWAGEVVQYGQGDVSVELDSCTNGFPDGKVLVCWSALILFGFNVPVNCWKLLYVRLVSTVLYLDALRQITERLQLPSMWFVFASK